MNKHFQSVLLQSTKAKEVLRIEEIQSLWSGYGKIMRFYLKDAEMKSVVVKHVRLPEKNKHPRGWNSDLSHQRKLKSYRVETDWYSNWSQLCDENSRIPKCLALEKQGDEVFMVLEDLDASGFSERKSDVTWIEIKACLKWLANFHATFLGKKPAGLWEIGTYWHLETRPEELEKLKDIELKKAAKYIDQKLNESPFLTFVHGDAKLANFCFSKDGTKVAAVDFQYVGGGCGMKDVAYFIGSCLYEDDCERLEEQLLDYYFKKLKEAITQTKKQVDFASLEQNWRDLYPCAWTDFHRFLKGWSPGHWKINSYSEKLAKIVLAEINEVEK
jgi:hypothetical protein